jgi:hypothetical protein
VLTEQSRAPRAGWDVIERALAARAGESRGQSHAAKVELNAGSSS